MSSWRLVLRSLRYHWRINLSVMLGVAAATAVLTGAMLVGDSMRASLRHLVLDRLGRIDEVLVTNRFFRSQLVQELAGSPGFAEHFEEALPVILLRGTIENPENELRSGNVTTLGCGPEFWTLGGGLPAAATLPADGEIMLNEPLAAELQVAPGGDVLLRLGQVESIPADSPLGRKIETTRSRRLKVVAIIPAQGLGGFSLQPNQQASPCAFTRTETLQSVLAQPDRVNGILVAAGGTASADAGDVLRAGLRPRLDDYGLLLNRVQARHEGKTVFDYFNLTSREMVLPPAVESAALAAFGSDAQPAFTYLANYIQAGDGAARIPYSTVTAVDSIDRLGPLLDAEGNPIRLADDQIALNSWAADDLTAQGVTLGTGDKVQLTFFEPESTHGEEREQTETFALREIARLAAPGDPPELINDPDLTPEVPGVTDQASIDRWDPPFPYDSKRVRIVPPNDQDERYWEQYRTTPKAFVSWATGQRLWRSRFGGATSVRLPASDELSVADLSQKLESQIDPAELGFAFRPVKREGMEAARGTTSFSGLFLGFSFFIIAAAIMLVALLFRLGVEQRARELGLLLAVGLRRGRAGLLLAAEGTMVAVAGGLLGMSIGVGYAWLMLAGLRTWWVAAIVTPFLRLDTPTTTLATGWFSGACVCAATIAWTLWSIRRTSARRLLAGQAAEPTGLVWGRRRWSLASVIAAVLLVLAVALAAAATTLSGEAEAGAFFGSGAALLTAGLLWLWAWLRGSTHGAAIAGGIFPLARLASRNAGRNPGRSTLTIGLVAASTFLIVAISAFRLDPSLEGAGGFDLMAETTQPIVHDLNTVAGREAAGIPPEEAGPLTGSHLFSLRTHAGDDASCTNLYQPRRPRILGVPPDLVQYYSRPEVVGFAWAETAAETDRERQNPWLLLDAPASDGAIPVVLDKNTAMYSMHLFVLRGVGTEFSIEDELGRELQFRIVGLLSNSIFQGSLLIGESHFERLFPDTSGYRTFLLRISRDPSGGDPAARQQPDPRQIDAVLTLLEQRLSDQGFDAQRCAARLEGLLAVQNTYLMTFQSLGALGLLLGTFGLATVQLRSVLERRGELALLRAAGFRRWRLAGLVMLENSVLLLAGLCLGLLAALVAVSPHLFGGGARIPLDWLSLMLAIVLVVGLISSFASVRATLKAPLLAALRAE